eukprot:SAG31_NODE_37487_length_303_cov_42.740196_2_plen_27_part_01
MLVARPAASGAARLVARAAPRGPDGVG